MPRPTLPFLNKEVTRHGKIAWYVRRGRGERIRIYPAFGTPEFKEAYRLALAGQAQPKPEGVKPARPKWRAPRKSFVYFIASGDLVKIGVTTDMAGRREALQTAAGSRLRLLKKVPGTQKDERELHARFAALRCRGEWFHYRGALKAYLEGLPEPDEDEEEMLVL